MKGCVFFYANNVTIILYFLQKSKSYPVQFPVCFHPHGHWYELCACCFSEITVLQAREGWRQAVSSHSNIHSKLLISQSDRSSPSGGHKKSETL